MACLPAGDLVARAGPQRAALAAAHRAFDRLAGFLRVSRFRVVAMASLRQIAGGAGVRVADTRVEFARLARASGCEWSCVGGLPAETENMMPSPMATISPMAIHTGANACRTPNLPQAQRQAQDQHHVANQIHIDELHPASSGRTGASSAPARPLKRLRPKESSNANCSRGRRASVVALVTAGLHAVLRRSRSHSASTRTARRSRRSGIAPTRTLRSTRRPLKACRRSRRPMTRAS